MTGSTITARSLCMLASLTLLIGCSSGRATTTGVPPIFSAPLPPAAPARTTQGFYSGHIVYVLNGSTFNGVSILEFEQINGNHSPIREIKGPATQLGFGAGRMAIDALGYVYVVMLLPAKILVFAPFASGNVAPVRVIEGPNTHLTGPFIEDIDLDSTGKLYVADERILFPSGLSKSTIQEYAPGANGNAPVVNEISAGPANAEMLTVGMALAKPQTSIWVAFINTGLHHGIANFPIGASGPVPWTCVISGSQTGLDAIPFHSHQPGVLAARNGSVTSIVGQGGDVTINTYAGCGNIPPLTRLGGPNTGIVDPLGIAFDGEGSLYVASPDLGAATTSSIRIFKPNNQNGDVVPDFVITGSNTQLAVPVAVEIGP